MANDVTIHVKAEDHASKSMAGIGKKVEVEAKRSFTKVGASSAAAFAAGFIKTITFGQVGGGFAQSAVKLAPSMARAGGVLGAGLAAGLLFQLSQALSAGLPLVMGGAILAGPLIYLWKTQAKEVDKLKARAKGFIDFISKPLRKPFGDVLRVVGDGLDRLKKPVRDIVGYLSSGLKPLSKGVMKGLEAFITGIAPSMPSIKAGMTAWGDAAPRIGKAMGDFVNKIMEDPKGTVDAVNGLADSLVSLADAAGNIVVGLRKARLAYGKFAEFVDKHEDKSTTSVLGVKMAEGIRKAWPKVKKAYDWFNNHLNKALDNIVQEHKHPVQAIKGAMSSIASAVRSGANRALSGLRSFASGAKSRFQSVVAAARYGVSGIRSMMSNMASAVRSGASRVVSVLRSLAARIRGAFAGAGHWLVGAGRAIVNGLVAGIRGAAGSVTGAVGGVVSRAIAFGKGLIGRASGGNVGAHAAEGGARGGRVLVGEQGPEIVDLPYGSHVNSNADSQRIASQQGGGGGRDVHIHFHNSVVAGASDLQRMLSDMKRRGQLDVILR